MLFRSKNLPVGTEYRDLVKLIPGVQYTQDAVRGPSAGGSGQDNVYNFDGVNVTLPLFGTLASEPASHDNAQIAVIKGGARAKAVYQQYAAEYKKRFKWIRSTLFRKSLAEKTALNGIFRLP